MKDTLTTELEALREGRTSFAEFSADTEEAWTNFARYLMRKWRAPVGVDLEDVRQEILVAAWAAVREWEPGRGPSLRKYVVFCAIDKGKKWLHVQRRAGKKGDAARSRHPVSFAELGLEPDQEEHLLQQAPLAEDLAAGRQSAERAAARPFEHSAEVAAWRLGPERGRALLRAIAGLDERDRVAVAAIAACEGDLDAAADMVASSVSSRLELMLGSDEAADRFVRGAAGRLAEALAT